MLSFTVDNVRTCICIHVEIVPQKHSALIGRIGYCKDNDYV